MKKTIKFLIVFLMIFSALAIPNFSSSQALPALRYGMNRWLADEVKDLTNSQRTAANDARYWPSTAANDANFFQAQAYTLTAIQNVIRQEAANEATFANLVTPTLLQQAVSNVRLSDVLLNTSWYGMFLGLGLDAIGETTWFTKIAEATANPNSATFKTGVTVVNTPAGLRVGKKIEAISGQQVQTANAAVQKAYQYGADIYRTDACLTGDFCAQFPPRNTSVDYGYFLQEPVSYDYIETAVLGYNGSASNEQIIVNYTYTSPGEVPEIYAYFKKLEDYILYLDNSSYCAPATRKAVNLNLVGYYSYGPQCIRTILSKTWNADYTFEQYSLKTSTAKTRADGLGGIQTYYQDVIRPFTNYVDVYGTNLGKITFENSDLNATLDAASAARFLNKVWDLAQAQPDYKGLTKSLTNPITAAQLKPQTIPLPKLADLIEFVINPDGKVYISPTGLSPDPLVVANPETNPDASTTPNDKPKIDLTAPPLQAPTLETPPTALAILQPLLDLIAPNSTISYSKPVGTCPTSTMSVMGTSYTFESHCTMLEGIRAALGAIMLTLFAFASYRIVMKA